HATAKLGTCMPRRFGLGRDRYRSAEGRRVGATPRFDESAGIAMWSPLAARVWRMGNLTHLPLQLCLPGQAPPTRADELVESRRWFLGALVLVAYGVTPAPRLRLTSVQLR